MTKRFTGEFDKQYSGVHDNGEQLTNFEVVDLLNNLSEEKEKLKKDCSNLIDDNTEYVAEINQMHKENEQLKQINQEIYELIAYYVTTHHSISTMRLFKKIKTLIKKGDLND